MHRAALHTSLATAVMLFATFAGAQERRRAPGPGEMPTPQPGDDAGSRARYPFSGVWRGSLTMTGDVPDAGKPTEIGMMFQITDTVARVYSGATLFPGNATSKHLKSTSTASGLQWEEKNSGPGFFVYTARLASPDSIVGTVTLRDGNMPGAPKGTFVLVRRKPGVRPAGG